MADQVNDSAASNNPKEPNEAPQAQETPEANVRFHKHLLNQHLAWCYGNPAKMSPGDPIRIDEQRENHRTKERCQITVKVSTTKEGQFELILKNAFYLGIIDKVDGRMRGLTYRPLYGSRVNVIYDLEIQDKEVISALIDALGEFQDDVSGKNEELHWAVANTTIEALERLMSCMEECTP